MKIYEYACVESTNKTAKEMISAGAEHGTVIVAESQTAGKGRYGRTFFSPPGGIYMSIILRSEHVKFDNESLITAFAAVSVCEAIEMISDKKPQIKWVNDIYLEDKKVCGILTEAIAIYGVQWIVIGIGINFETPAIEFSEELQEIAGVVFSGGEPPITRERLAIEITKRIIVPKNQYNQNKILALYKKRLNTLGKNIIVHAPGEIYEATAIDIDNTGRLIVKRNSGELQALSSGEISVKL